MKKTGIVLRGSRGRKDVKIHVLEFAKWLRKTQDFPVRVSIYLLPGDSFVTVDGDTVVASFRWFSTKRNPYIRLATGDYPSLCKEMGRDGAIESILISLARQIVRYQNWCRSGKCTDHGVKQRSYEMVDNFYESLNE